MYLELSRDFERKRRSTAGECNFERRTFINERDFFNEGALGSSAVVGVSFVRLIVDALRNNDEEVRRCPLVFDDVSADSISVVEADVRPPLSVADFFNPRVVLVAVVRGGNSFVAVVSGI